MKIHHIIICIIFSCANAFADEHASVSNYEKEIIEKLDATVNMIDTLRLELERRGVVNIPNFNANLDYEIRIMALRSAAAQYAFDYYKNKFEGDLQDKSRALGRQIISVGDGIRTMKTSRLDLGEYEVCSQQTCSTPTGKAAITEYDYGAEYMNCVRKTCLVPASIPIYSLNALGIDDEHLQKDIYYGHESGINRSQIIQYLEETPALGKSVLTNIQLIRRSNIGAPDSQEPTFVNWEFSKRTRESDLQMERESRLKSNQMIEHELPPAQITNQGASGSARGARI
jgi:hypothetical protein